MEKHEIELHKLSKRRLTHDNVFAQVSKLLDAVTANKRGERGWGVTFKNRESINTPRRLEGEYRYTALLVVTCDQDNKPEILRKDFNNIIVAIGKAGETTRLTGSWKIELIDGVAVDALKDERLPKEVGYADVSIPENWSEFFEHIYNRQPQIEIMMSVIQAGIHSGWQDRFHVALIGDPACVSGDTVVEINRAGKSFKLPISQLHRDHGKWDHAITTTIRCYDNGTVRLAEVAAVLYTGKKEVYQVKTASGFSVKTTNDHQFLSANGWSQLADLKAGDLVNVNVIDECKLDEIQSIVLVGIEDVYDVALYDEPHNFIANGIVVHNCGKTEILRSAKRMLGDEAVLEYDATATTQAGAIKDLDERASNGGELPRILIVEEIEKADENSLRWLLSVMDHRAEIRKTTARSSIQRETKLLTMATVNDYKSFQRIMSGALASRFCYHLLCQKLDRRTLQLILEREVERVGGSKRWIKPTLDFGDMEGITDPRRLVAICLCGRDDLISGDYLRKLQATSAANYLSDK